jgi:hypothetical protein
MVRENTVFIACDPCMNAAGTATDSADADAAASAALDGAASGDAPVAGIVLEGDALSLGLVAVRDTRSAKGHGVFALTSLPSNTWVGDYVGEVLTQKRYLRRYPREDARYVLGANEDYNVDASDPHKSSFTRYLNHATGDAANVFFEVVKVRRQRAKTIKFYTGRQVTPGEELCFDYGPEYWRDRDPI